MASEDMTVMATISYLTLRWWQTREDQLTLHGYGEEKGLTVWLVELDAGQKFKIAGIRVRRWRDVWVKRMNAGVLIEEGDKGAVGERRGTAH